MPQKLVLVAALESLPDSSNEPFRAKFLDVAPHISYADAELARECFLRREALPFFAGIPNQAAVTQLRARTDECVSNEGFGNEDAVKESIGIEGISNFRHGPDLCRRLDQEPLKLGSESGSIRAENTEFRPLRRGSGTMKSVVYAAE